MHPPITEAPGPSPPVCLAIRQAQTSMGSRPRFCLFTTNTLCPDTVTSRVCSPKTTGGEIPPAPREGKGAQLVGCYVGSHTSWLWGQMPKKHNSSRLRDLKMGGSPLNHLLSLAFSEPDVGVNPKGEDTARTGDPMGRW